MIIIMILDILLLVVMIVCAFLGYKKGFLRSVISILKGITSLVIAILVSKPIASLLDKITGLGRAIGRLFAPTVEALGKTSEWFTTSADAAATADQLATIKGTDLISTILEKIVKNIVGGAGEKIIGNTPAAYACSVLGFFALIVLTAILVFIIVRLILRVLDRFIQKLTENNTGFSIDAWLGSVFGIVRFALQVMCWMVMIFVLSQIPFINGIAQWLFSGSVICNWLYNITGQLVMWFFETFDIVSMVASALGLG